MTSTSTATRGGFRLLLAAIVVSGFGTSAMWLAAGIWVKDLTGSDSLAALCAFALWAPALAGPLLGTVADRTRRRPLLVAVNLGLGLLLLSLMAVDSAGSLWILFAVLVAYGACGVVTDAAEAALVPAVVGRQSLGDFNGLRTTADEGMKLVAPLAGAGLFAVYGGAGVALLDAATFAAAAGLYARLRVRESVPDRRAAGVWFRSAEGVRALWRQERLRPLVLAAAATMLLAGLNGAALYAVVDGGLGRSPSYAGVLYAVQGAGSVVAGLAAGGLLRRLGERRFAAAGIALFAVGAGLRALPYDAVALGCSAAIGMGLPCVLIAALTAVQRETPHALVGRAVATAHTLMFAPNAVALAMGAGLIAVVDHRVLLPLLGAAGLAVACATARRPSA
ncbi:MFS transporter [Streptomyces sp. NPDC058321]|uniref:MFS transporter n=1 Tax=unclassified Streptomyces TaxID=2593676 RepID=UPI002251C68E|nr:MFS transporter [Streptomyces sp. NBC_00063]MCX5436525.1 MFS transporter [Streptomyces sp. NBC_00063]